MSPRTGRPTDDPKILTIKFRVSEADKEKLAYCSDFYKITKAEVIRQGIDKM